MNQILTQDFYKKLKEVKDEIHQVFKVADLQRRKSMDQMIRDIEKDHCNWIDRISILLTNAM